MARKTQIDSVGWIVAAFAVVIAVIAGIVVYDGTHIQLASLDVPQTVGTFR